MSIRLSRISTEPPDGTSKESIKQQTDRYANELAELDDLLFAAREHGVLVVLQGRDTAGKDGAIRRVLDCSNAQGVRVEAFKVPSDDELAHDFLWRVHARTPARGEIVLFNRSHYEDVLVTRVHDLFPKKVIEQRYDAINDFERMLCANRTILIKFFLHITKDEQKRRLLDREKETEKAWKLSVGDWSEREFWDDYTRAYEIALDRCATREAPWHIVPADEKWYRNYVVIRTIVDRLRPYKKEWLESLSRLGTRRRDELHAFRGKRR